MSSLKLATGGDDIKLWDVPNFQLHQQYSPHESTISDMSWSYDGQFLASAAAKGDKIALSYISNGNFSTGDVAANANQQCVRFSSVTARYLMTGGKDGQVNVWDMKNRKLKKAYLGHTDRITRVQFNWNDSYIVSGSNKGDILVHNVTTGQACAPLRAPKVQAIRDLKYNEVRRALFGSASDDGSINLWDANIHRLSHQFKESHTAPAMGLCFSPINEVLLTSVGLDKKLVYYDMQSKLPVKVYSGGEPFTCIDILHDGVTVAAGTMCGKVFVYDLRKSSDPLHIILAHKAAVQCLAFQTSPSTTKHHDPPIPTVRATTRSASYSPKRMPLSSSSSSSFDPSSQINSSPRKQKDNMSLVSSPPLFSPPREELDASPDPSVRKQPIGGGHCKSTKMLGDRPATTGLAESDSLTNGSIPESSMFRQSPPMLKRRAASSSPRSSRLVSHERRKDRSASQIKLSSVVGDSTSKIPIRGGPTGEDRTFDALYRPVCSKAPSPPVLEVASTSSYGVLSSLSSISPMPTLSQDRIPSLPPTKDALSAISSCETVATLVSAGEPAPSSAGACGITVPLDQIRQVVQEVVRDAMDEVQETLHQDIVDLHVDLVRQFLFQKAETERLLRYYSVNEELVAEIERLRDENRRLQARF